MSLPQHPALSDPLAASAPDDDQARADFYALLARLLLAPPDAGLLHALAGAGPVNTAGEFALEDSWRRLTRAAGATDAGAVAGEFLLLFAGAGAGGPLLHPFASFYLAGHPDGAPLARLRHDLARLGLGRAHGVDRSEDHLGALCDSMHILVAGAPGFARQPLLVQKRFFEAHLRPWYAACLADLAGAGAAGFYLAVAGVADAFLSIEAQAFSVLDAADTLPG